MAEVTTYTPAQRVEVEGTKFQVRTAIVYATKENGGVDTGVEPNVVLQYKPEGPFQSFQNLADRTSSADVNNGWEFTSKAGAGFRKELLKKGPDSLTAKVDNATTNHYAKETGTSVQKATEQLSNVLPIKRNVARTDPNQNIDSPRTDASVPNSRESEEQAKRSKRFTDRLRNAPAKANTRNKKGDFAPMRYPEIMDSKQDKLKIDMISFTPRALTAGGTGFADRDISNSLENIIGTVTLAIPGGIRDENSVKWGSQDMNIAQARAANFGLAAIEGNNKEVTASLDQLKKDAGNDAIKSAIGLGFAGAAVGAQGLLARTSGSILNPNTELLFAGPQLRSFTFTFPFSPRSRSESQEVQRIIRFFKQGMAVQRTEDAIFLKAPNIFKLKYFNGDSEHRFLPKMKVCALLNCSVDYTPDGNYSTYQNSSMTKYTMSLTFNELDPLYNDEYDDDTTRKETQTTDIGF